MRRLSSSWSETFFAQLGYRRKKPHRPFHSRRSLFEALEERAMLAGTPAEDLIESSVMIATPLVGASVELPSPTYVLVSETRGDNEPSNQFVVRTEYAADGTPRAVVSLREGLTQIDDTLHTLQIELQFGEWVLARQEVLIDIESKEFRDRFLQDRLTQVNEELATVETVDVHVLADAIDANRELNDPTSTEGSDVIDITSEQIDVIAKSMIAVPNTTVDAGTKLTLYSVLESEAKDITAAKLAADTDEVQALAPESAKEIGRAALLLANQIVADLASSDSDLKAAAQGLRDELVRTGEIFYTVFTGLGVNQELYRETLDDGREAVLGFLEAGSYELGENLRVDLGPHQAMVQGTYGPTFGSAASQVTVSSTHDTYVVPGESPEGEYGLDTTLVVASTAGNPTSIALISFDLNAEKGKLPSQAALKLNVVGSFPAGTTHRVSAHYQTWGSQLNEHSFDQADYAAIKDDFRQLGTVTQAQGGIFAANITEAAQRALLLGDSNLDGTVTVSDTYGVALGDVEAFYQAVRNWTGYVAQYEGVQQSQVVNELLFRNDANWDGQVNANDIAQYFLRLNTGRGNYNLDGATSSSTSGADYSVWSQNYGRVATRFSQGDGDFNGYVDDADFTIWQQSNVGTHGSLQATRLLLRVESVSGNSTVTFEASENSNPPKVELTYSEPEAWISKFVGKGGSSGQLEVQYRVPHTSINPPTIKVYRVAHTATGNYEQEIASTTLTNTVSAASTPYSWSFNPNMIADRTGDYTIVAKLFVDGAKVSEHELSGGVFKDAGDNWYVLGGIGNDIVTVMDDNVQMSGDFSLNVPSYAGPTNFYVRTHAGYDSITLWSGGYNFAWLAGGDQNDSYELKDDVYFNSKLEIEDESGLDSLIFSANINFFAGVNLETAAPQDVLDDNLPPQDVSHLSLRLIDTPIEVVFANNTSSVIGPGYNGQPIIVDTLTDVPVGVGVPDDMGLRKALALAASIPGENVIRFDETLFTNGPESVELSSGQLIIDDDVTIEGPGPHALTIDAQNNSRVLLVNGGVEATISGLTISGGRLAAGNQGAGILNWGTLTLNRVDVMDNHVTVESADGGGGGGIYSQGSLTLVDSTVENNSAHWGGGITFHADDQGDVLEIRSSSIICNTGSAGGGLLYQGAGASVEIANSTFSGNTAPWLGGGLLFDSSNTPVSIINSTIVYNEAQDGGGGGLFTSAPTTLLNTIIAHNIAPTYWQGLEFHPHDDIWAYPSLTTASQYNLIRNVGWSGLSGLTNQWGDEADPLDADLDSLDYYGGPTKTHALLDGSPAIDKGNAATLTGDQRGAQPRFDDSIANGPGGYSDIGAFELIPFSLELNGTGTVSYVTGTTPGEPIAPAATLSGSIDKLTISITNSPNFYKETLTVSLPTDSKLKAQYSDGVLTLTGFASAADYQEALRSVCYKNLSPLATSLDRILHVVAYQGTETESEDVTVGIAVNGKVAYLPVNDVSLYPDAWEIEGGQAPELLISSTNLSDILSYGANLQFDLTAFEPSTVASAHLRLYMTEAVWHESELWIPKNYLWLSENNWSETLGPDSPPWLDLPIAQWPAAPGEWVDVDITNELVASLNADKILSFSVLSDHDFNPVQFRYASEENENFSLRPQLVITSVSNNSMPEAAADTYDTISDGFTLNVSARNGLVVNDSDADGFVVLTASQETAPLHGKLVLNADGSFDYTADKYYRGTDSFTYRVFDGIDYSAPATVTINVQAVQEIHLDDVADAIANEGAQSLTSFGESLVIDGDDGAAYVYLKFPVNSLNLTDVYDGHVTLYTEQIPYEAIEGGLDFLIPGQQLPSNVGPQYHAGIKLSAWQVHDNSWWEITDPDIDSESPPPATNDSLPRVIFGTPTQRLPLRIVVGGNVPPVNNLNELTHQHIPLEVDVTDYLEYLNSQSETELSLAIRVNVTGGDYLQGNLAFFSHESPYGQLRPQLVIRGTDLLPHDNLPPEFTSPHIVEADVGKPYHYEMTATDREGDKLVFSLPLDQITWPTDYQPGPLNKFNFSQATIVINGETVPVERGIVDWTPPEELAGKTVKLVERVVDSAGNITTRDIEIYVKPPANAPPVIIANPAIDYVLPTTITNPPNPNGTVTPQEITIMLADGEEITLPISITPTVQGLTSEIVFVIDISISMQYGFNWLKNSIGAIDDALWEKGFGTRHYGLTLFDWQPYVIDSFQTNSTDSFTWNDSGKWTDDVAEFAAKLANPGVSRFGLGAEFGYDALLAAVDPANYDFKSNSVARDTASQIVLISDEEVDGYFFKDYMDWDEQLVEGRTTIRRRLLERMQRINTEDSDPNNDLNAVLYDDIPLTAIVNARYAGTISQDRDGGFVVQSGNWQTGAQGYQAKAISRGQWALSVLDAGLTNDYMYHYRVGTADSHPMNKFFIPLSWSYGPPSFWKELHSTFQISAGRDANAAIVFGYQDENNFGFVRADANTDTWTVGAVVDGVEEYLLEFDSVIEAGQEYEVRITFDVDFVNDHFVPKGPSRIVINGTLVHDLPSELWSIQEGQIGLATFGGQASFSKFELLSIGDGEESEPKDEYSRDHIRYDFLTGRFFPALGYTAYGQAYFDAGNGEYDKGIAPDTVFSMYTEGWFHDDNVKEDYVDLALASGGSVWDQAQLRGVTGDASLDEAGSFSKAFADTIAYQALANKGFISVQHDGLSIDATTIKDVVHDTFGFAGGSGGIGSFAVTFRGDGGAHRYNLEFVQGEDSDIIGHIPVHILAPYVVDFDALDPDSNLPLTFSWAPGSDIREGAKLVDTDPVDNYVNNRLIWTPPSVIHETEYTFGVTVTDSLGLKAQEDFWWTVTVKPSATNHDPSISETTPPKAYVGRAYELDIIATDQDSDRLRFFLDNAPENMTIDPYSGRIEWIPRSTDVGAANVTVRVVDGRFTPAGGDDYEPGQDTLQFTIQVEQNKYANLAPSVPPIPDRLVYWTESLNVRVTATDADQDPLSYSLISPPDGMVIHPQKGIITWTPRFTDVGQTYEVSVTVADGNGGSTTRPFTVSVNLDESQLDVNVGDLQKGAPQFGGPQREAVIKNQSYTYAFTLTSPTKITDLQSQVLLSAPGGSINFSAAAETQPIGTAGPYVYTGLVFNWTPAFVGTFPIRIEATNDAGFSSSVEYNLKVVEAVSAEHNSAPEFRTIALGPFAVGQRFHDVLDVDDPDGHVVTFSLGPATTAPGFNPGQLNSLTGAVDWTPDTFGDFQIVIIATDELDASRSMTFPIHIKRNASPEIKAGIIPTVFVEQIFIYPFVVTDPNAGNVITVTLNPEAIAAGLTVENTGGANWNMVWANPTMDSSDVPVTVTASDGRGGIRSMVIPALHVYESDDPSAPLNNGSTIQVPFGTEYRLEVIPPQLDSTKFLIELIPDPNVPNSTLPDGITIKSDAIVFRPTYAWTGPPDQSINPVSYSVKLKVYDNSIPISPVLLFDPSLTLQVVKPDNLVLVPPQIDKQQPTPNAATAAQQFIFEPALLANGTVGGLTWLPVDVPAGLVIDATTGRMTWTPARELVGKRVTAKFRIVDRLGLGDIHEFELAVKGVNEKPVFETTFPKLWKKDETLTLTLLARDPEGQPIEFERRAATGQTLPSGLTISTDSAGNASLQWITTTGLNSDEYYTFIVRAKEKFAPDDSFTDQEVTIHLLGGTFNRDPLILGSPHGQFASAGIEFKFDFGVRNFDDDPNSIFSLESIDGLADTSPFGSVGFVNNQLSWTPTSAHVGDHVFKIRLRDREVENASDVQNAFLSFTLKVVKNAAPELSSTLTLQPMVGTQVVHQVAAHDPDGHSLSYAFDPAVAVPVGMTLNPKTGFIQWQVPTIVPETDPIAKVIVSDQYGASASQTITFDVQDDTLAPTVSLHILKPDGSILTPGEELNASLWNQYKIAVNVSDNLGEEQTRWRILVQDSAPNNQGQPSYNDTTYDIVLPDASANPYEGGYYEFSFDAGSGLNQGSLSITIEAVDHDGGAGAVKTTQTFRYYVNDPNLANQAKLLGDLTTKPIDSRIEVYGVAEHVEVIEQATAYGYYDLKLTSIDDPSDFVWIAQNQTANVALGQGLGGVLGTIDPSLLKSGVYRLYLEVRCPDGCIEAIDERIVEIRNVSRLGNLDLSFTDLSVDLGGIPVSLVRSYSSSRVGSGTSSFGGDFGPGWKLNLLQAGVTVAHPKQVTTNLMQPFAQGTRVLVELPDGNIERFSFAPQSVDGSADGPFNVYFRPDPETTSTLEVSGQDESLLLTKNLRRNDGTYASSNTNQDYVPHQFGSALVLTTRGGLRYLFDLKTGRLTAIEDQNGHSITIGEKTSATGKPWPKQQIIKSSDGTQQITIGWNASDQIVAILDPKNEDIAYEYTVGRLSKMTARDNRRTAYEYANTQFSHHLTGIRNYRNPTDTVGFLVLTADYFDSTDTYDSGLTESQKAAYYGRLQNLTDVSGQSANVGFALQLSGGRTVTTVASTVGGVDIVVEEVRNSRGDVLRRIQPVLDSNGAPHSDKFLITEFKHNARGLVTHESVPFIVDEAATAATNERYDTLATAWARIVKYDGKDRVEQTTDAFDHATMFKYDENDRVIETTDPNGNITHSVYNADTGDLLETYLTAPNDPRQYNHSRFEYEGGRLVASYQINGDQEQLVSRTHFDDSSGRVDWTEDSAGNRRYFGYDANGNQTHSWQNWVDPNIADRVVVLINVASYDVEGRGKESQEFELVRTGADAAIENFSVLTSALSDKTPLSTTATDYDDQGRVEWSQDRFANYTYNVYDFRGNVIETRTQVDDPNSTDPGWLVTRTLYDDQGRVEFTTDPYFVAGTADPPDAGTAWLGTHTVYDVLGRVTATQRYSGVTISLIDDTAHSGDLKISQLPTNWDWDSSGTRRSESKTHYDDLGRVEHTLSESGARTDYYYDTTGRQIAVLGPVVTIKVNGDDVQQRHLTRSVFDPSGRLLQSISNIAVGNFDNSHADFNQHPEWALFEQNTAGLVQNAQQQSTFYEYDPAGRQTAVVTTSIPNPNYNASGTAGAFDTLYARMHLRAETFYDGFGRRTASREGLRQANAFDANTIDASQVRETNYEYDTRGNLTAVILPAVPHPTLTNSGQPLLVRPRYEYTYDQYGNRLTTRDNVYQAATGIFYQHGGTASNFSQNYDTRVTSFTYDHRNRQTSRTLPLGVDTTNVATDFVEKMVYDDTPVNPAAIGADKSVGNGQLCYSVDFEGRVTAYFYDNTSQGGGRLVEKRYYNSESAYTGNANSPAEKVTYVYDEFGREKTVTFDHGGNVDTTTNYFDNEGRPTRQVVVDGTVTSALNYEYDRITGQQIRVYTGNTDSDYLPATGEAVTDTRYIYDALGRLSQVVVTERFDTDLSGPTTTWRDKIGTDLLINGEITTYGYDLLGNLDYTRLPGDATTDYVYDELNRLTDQFNFQDTNLDGDRDTGEALYGRYDYTLDVHGRRTSVVETDAGNKTTRIDWVYDALGRLTEEKFDFDTSNSHEAHDFRANYTFDLVGNRLEKTVDKEIDSDLDEVFAYLYDRNDRLYVESFDDRNNGVGVNTTTTYEFGSGATPGTWAGSGTEQTKKTEWQGTTIGGTKLSETTNTYNLQGRLKQSNVDADGPGGTPPKIYDYEYDDNGIRISQTIDGQKTIYVVSANNPTGYSQVLEENDSATGQITKTYTIGQDVHTLAVVGAVYHHLYDGHGSTRALLNSSTEVALNGSTRQLFAYDAYGNLLNLSGYAIAVEQALTSLLYSGEQNDKTGLQYLRARYYDPRMGRFNRLDPIAGNFVDPQSLHKYLYGHGDSINHTDPSGLLIEPAEIGKEVHKIILTYYQLAHLGDVVFGGFKPWSGAPRLYPDIVNLTRKTAAETKTATPSEVRLGKKQLQGYLQALNSTGTAGSTNWTADLWTPSLLLTYFWVGAVNPQYNDWYGAIVGNDSGVIKYTLWKKNNPSPQTVPLAVPIEQIETDTVSVYERLRRKLQFEDQLITAYSAQATHFVLYGTALVTTGIALTKAVESWRGGSVYGSFATSSFWPGITFAGLAGFTGMAPLD